MSERVSEYARPLNFVFSLSTVSSYASPEACGSVRSSRRQVLQTHNKLSSSDS
jgi:hypothetical protein